MRTWKRSLSCWVSCFSSRHGSSHGVASRRGVRGVALAGLVLLGMALAAPVPGSAQIPRGKTVVRASMVARLLAREIQKVQTRFEKNREALEDSEGPAGAPAYERSDVRELVQLTEVDLLRAIDRVKEPLKEPGLVAMQDWVKEEFRRLREGLDAEVEPVLAATQRPPRAVAVVASLGPVVVEEDGGSASRVSKALDAVGSLLENLFVLSRDEELQIQVGAQSLPQPGVLLLIYPPSRPSHKERAVTDGPVEAPVWRGLYLYEVKKRNRLLFGCTKESMGNDWFECSLDLLRHSGPIQCHLGTNSEAPCEVRSEGQQCRCETKNEMKKTGGGR